MNSNAEKIPIEPDQPGYTRLQVRLHWAVVGLLILQWAASSVMTATLESLQSDEAPSAMQFLVSSIHVYGGMTLFILVCVRIRLRWIHGPAFRRSSVHGFIGLLAPAVHAGFYLILLMMPVTGSLAYYEVWPAASNWHHFLGQVLLLLVLLHVAAVGVHYFLFKDGVAQRMVGRRRP